MEPETHDLLSDYKNAYPVAEMPAIQSKDHIVMESLADLKRICSDFNLPLLFMLRGKVVYSGVLGSPDLAYTVYFTQKDGLYYVFLMEVKKQETKTPSMPSMGESEGLLHPAGREVKNINEPLEVN